MARFEVEITEHLPRMVIVEASSAGEARRLAREGTWLDAGDFDSARTRRSVQSVCREDGDPDVR